MAREFTSQKNQKNIFISKYLLHIYAKKAKNFQKYF